MKNLSPKDNPKTTIPGICLLVIAIIMLIAPMFYEVKSQTDPSAAYWVGAVGIGLWLSPDTVITAVKKFLSRKNNE